MLDLIKQEQRESQSRLTFNLARSVAEVTEAQRIRYKVFAEEMGAKLPSADLGLDIDRFDEFCDHLLVRDHSNDKVVGTYRILPPEQAHIAGGYYSETEFDLSRLMHLRDRMAEVGRSCVHPDYRDGATITQLWAGLADYIGKHGHEYMIGCASISMADGGHAAANLFDRLGEYMSPIEYRVFPRCPLPLSALRNEQRAAVPPLLKGYLRAGAFICGEPAWDPDFNTADLPILMPMAKISDRYSRHFLEKNRT